MRLDTARIKRLRVCQDMEIKRYKSLNWNGNWIGTITKEIEKKASRIMRKFQVYGEGIIKQSSWLFQPYFFI